MPNEYHGPEPLSANAKFAAWVALGGLVLVGFGFGLWAGTRPPEPKAKEVAKVTTPEPKKAATPAPKAEPRSEPKPEPKPELVEKKPEPKPEPKPVEPVVVKKPEPKPAPKPEPKANVPEVTFAKDIQPLIRSHCLTCHGTPKIQGGFDMRTLAAVMKGGDSGDALKPGDPSKGSMWALIKDGEMPPAGKPKLTDAEKKLFHDWIAGGAK
jgi:protein TonB